MATRVSEAAGRTTGASMFLRTTIGPAADPSEEQQPEPVLQVAAYLINRRYLYTVGRLKPQTLASSLTFIFLAANVG